MIRYPFICNQILRLYRTLQKIEYPMKPELLFETFANCKTMTYQKFAGINNCSESEVVLLCESKSGCTHYDVINNRYLVLYNESHAHNNVSGRILWTKAHELGHVALKHLPYLAASQIAENNFNNVCDPELEKEADYFAATFLAPFPAYGILNVQSHSDIQAIFGLSEEASKNRMSEYLRWQKTRVKTAWENDIKKLITSKS